MSDRVAIGLLIVSIIAYCLRGDDKGILTLN